MNGEAATKRQFFNELHLALGEKYNVPPRVIAYIRSNYFNHNSTPQDIINTQKRLLPQMQEQLATTDNGIKRREKLVLRFPQDKEKHHKKRIGGQMQKMQILQKIEFRNTVIKFLTGLKPKQWEEITQRTKYDRGVQNG